MMMNRMIAPLLAMSLLAFAPPVNAAPADSAAGKAPATVSVPGADHHQHLFSPRIVALINSPAIKEVPAAALVANLDQLGIRRATVLSTAYMFGRPDRNLPDEYELVRAENDWTAQQAAQYPDRLVAFCGINPMRDYALKELARCAAHPGLRRGVKMHIGNSDIQFDDPAHVARLGEFFKAANRARMAIVVHLRASISKKRPYGAVQARVFLDQLLPLAPDVPVQIAHLAGTGPGFEDPPAQEALAVFAEAVERGHPATKNLWFDIASNADGENSPETTALLVKRMRQIGMARLLYGSDTPTKQAQAWEAFRRLPLTQAEFAQIAANQAPYLR
ncbi:amidohydrolase family protein [Massilia sp. IC2-477]|uniref:amidohydrolase family protein n=1 Tax=Massilia sp. IC2-477 TaxID=2887198 RepID=UPI001D107190|nr:amidohydrolase family protein [Massilia sp. IC2-477]MCC2955703.1 amidohydrolase family protein [Massilia sp. IC2-477]